MVTEYGPMPISTHIWLYLGANKISEQCNIIMTQQLFYNHYTG